MTARLVPLPSRGKVAQLCFREYGDPSGFPVIFAHGNLNSRLFAPAWEKTEALTCEAKVRLIAVDRPGVGGSTMQENRSYLDFAEDIEVLADHLELSKFGVAGFSSGGPHALAVACKLQTRVSSLALVSSDGPYKLMGQDMIKKMYGTSELCLEEAKVKAQKNYESLKSAYTGMKNASRGELACADLEEAILQGFDGPASDSLLETGEWNFKVEDLVSPVHVWHGLADKDVPIACSKFLVNLFPSGLPVQTHYIEDESHSMIRRHWKNILCNLVESSSAGNGKM
mmetsp:Transcript_7159/g.8224  ORF Transcript_7159/g.8224 Transcript_7159/m.8224 type:complete len:284 (+) Transcript_7159:74-925(+)|eukprot:CAMPEP_0184036390 /NCGR_PEP_ID=MMETSP0955-20130417/32193_1 /TAXON_ID=627963 /ORGANISM="Aplanochytrium sp, Strain PBS07" /LENGTH=283 /DNA_ID=CAMNT_0026324033 /DNA_START=94 /DNA_END=945 /DNA_ORIENTATION=+